MRKSKLTRWLLAFLFCCLSGACSEKKAKCDEITYTSVSGQIVRPDEIKFDAIVIENVYVDGVGHLRFNKEITAIKDFAFWENTDLKTIQIPASITSIGRSAFAYCTSLERIDFAENARLEVIDETAFVYTKLKSITIPPSVTEVGMGILAGCNSLQSIEGKYSANSNRALVYRERLISIAPAGLMVYKLEEPVKSVMENAFYGASHLETIILPPSVKGIGKGAFCECPKLKAIYFSSEMAPLLSHQGACFCFTNGFPVLYVPKDSPYGGHNDWYLINKEGHVELY